MFQLIDFNAALPGSACIPILFRVLVKRVYSQFCLYSKQTSVHCRGALEQGVEPTNAQIGALWWTGDPYRGETLPSPRRVG